MEEQDQKDIIAQYMENDAEILGGNGVHPHNDSEVGSIKNRYWKFTGAFLVIIVLGLTAIPFIGDYIKNQEREADNKEAEAYMQAMTDLRERLKGDKDGGATPEETLQLFTAALKKGDIEQAEKYFVFEPQERQQALIRRLEEIRNEGKFETFLGYLGELDYMPKSSDEHVAIFRNLNKEGLADLSIEITKDNYSPVWKIEGLMF